MLYRIAQVSVLFLGSFIGAVVGTSFVHAASAVTAVGNGVPLPNPLLLPGVLAVDGAAASTSGVAGGNATTPLRFLGSRTDAGLTAFNISANTGFTGSYIAEFSTGAFGQVVIGLGADGGLAPGAGGVQGSPRLYGGTGVPSFSAANGSHYWRYDGPPYSYTNTSGATSVGTTWSPDNGCGTTGAGHVECGQVSATLGTCLVTTLCTVGTFTFTTAYAVAPKCVVSNATATAVSAAAIPDVSAVSTTTATVSAYAVAALTGDVITININCVGA